VFPYNVSVGQCSSVCLVPCSGGAVRIVVFFALPLVVLFESERG
jgi:hypothetical protein